MLLLFSFAFCTKLERMSELALCFVFAPPFVGSILFVKFIVCLLLFDAALLGGDGVILFDDCRSGELIDLLLVVCDTLLGNLLIII